MAVARFLEKNPRVEKVVYPGKTAWVDRGGLARPLKIAVKYKTSSAYLKGLLKMMKDGIFGTSIVPRLRQTKGGLYCDVAMATLLAPVPFCFEPIIAICDSITQRDGPV